MTDIIVDHMHVRSMYTCPACSQPKDRGLLLCWPCHHKEKRIHDGCYSQRVELLLDALEREQGTHA